MIYFIGNINKITDLDNGVKSIDIDKAIEDISKETLICEDVETRGLDFTEPNQVRLIQIGTKDNQYIFDVETCDYIKLKEVMENKKIEKIVANGNFERNMLRSIGLVINSMFDLLLAVRVLRQGRNEIKVFSGGKVHSIYSLAGAYMEYLNKEINKEQQSSFLFGDSYTMKQIRYAAEDVRMFDLYEELTRRLKKFNLLTSEYRLYETVNEALSNNRFSVTWLEMKVLPVYADMSYNGINLDFNAMLKLYDKNVKLAKEIEIELNEYVVKNVEGYEKYYINPIIGKQGSLFGDSIDVEVPKNSNLRINWGSQQQVKKIIFKEVGEVKDKDGNETIGIKELDKPKYTSNKFISKYIEYKKLQKAISSYGAGYKKYISKNTGKVHCGVNQILNTGRIALKNPNLGQIPRGQEWRDLFRAPKGRKMIGADYSGQESQVMADKSGDDAFIDFFMYGDGDSHSMVASRVYSAKEEIEIVVKKKELFVEVLDDEDAAIEICSNLYEVDKDKVRIIEREGKKYAYTNKDSTGKENPLRQKGKTLNFFISFGGSAYTLHMEQGISMEEANQLLDNFWKGFPKLKIYFDKEKEKALKYGYILVNNISNRRRWLPEWKEWRQIVNELDKRKKELINNYGKKYGNSMYWEQIKTKGSDLRRLSARANIIKGDMERAAMNTGIQGTAADITKTAEVLLAEKLEQDGYTIVDDIKFVNHIHDEMLLEATEDKAEYTANTLRWAMESAANIFCSTLKLKAEPFIADVWKH